MTNNQAAFVRPGLVDEVVARDDKGAASVWRWTGELEDTRRFHFCNALSDGLLRLAPDPLLTGSHTGATSETVFSLRYSQWRRNVLGRGVVVNFDDLNESSAERGVSWGFIER